MSLLKIAWRSIQQRALASWLTGLSMALGVALVVLVLVLYAMVSRSFSNAAEGCNLILGKKGSSTQLLLNTVFHLQRPVENVPWDFYKQIKADKRVAVAVPFCLGDSYGESRVVGTTSDLFEKLGYGLNDDNTPKLYQCAAGRFFKDSEFRGAVIGSVAAYKTGLTVDDQFKVSHGLAGDEGTHEHEDMFTVMGVLKPTGTPNDRAIFINMEGFFLVSGHAKDKPEGHDDHHDHDEHDHHHHHHDEPLPEDQREVTAILVRMREHPTKAGVGDSNAILLATEINEGVTAQAISPTGEVTRLMEGLVGTVRWLLLVLAGLVVVVAGIGVMVSIYNSMSDRRRDIAIMRSLGAGKGTVMLVVLLESIMLSVLGGVAGVLLAHGTIGAAGPLIVRETGVFVSMWQFEPMELAVIPALVVLASIVGFLPALAAYKTDVAKALSAAP